MVSSIANKKLIADEYLFIEMLSEAMKQHWDMYDVFPAPERLRTYRESRKQIVTGTILAVLHSTEKKPGDFVNPGYIPKKETISYRVAEEFLKQAYRRKLRHYWEEWGELYQEKFHTVPSGYIIRLTCLRKNRKSFIRRFNNWTKMVSLYRPQLQSLDIEKVDMEHKHLVLHAATIWKKQNPTITQVMKGLLGDW
jgi:hypothetical protein